MTETQILSLDQAISRDWDTIVIGAGMGGSAMAYGLAQQGQTVLVVEKGHANHQHSDSVALEESDPKARLQSGRWPERIQLNIDGKTSEIWPPLGSGAGGSTLLYAAALHRLRRTEFSPQPHPGGGTVSWPFSYDDLDPHYSLAESLLGVRGTADPLDPDDGENLGTPIQLNARDQHFADAFDAAGLNPFRLHCGIQYVDGCSECLGRVCTRNCKRDARNTFLEPAMATGRVFLLAEAQVTEIKAGSSSVTGLLVVQGKAASTLQARDFVLAAGGYVSPVLLQNSASEDWPGGLANTHDQVGRNLMFHAGLSLALWAPRRISKHRGGKTLAFRDFYEVDGQKYGEVQSTGQTAGYGNILFVLRQMYDQGSLRNVPVLRQLLRIPAYAASKILGEATIFAAIVEDFAYPDNRVLADQDAPSGFRVHYDVPPELAQRTQSLARLIRKALQGMTCFNLTRSVALNFGHPCGTCRAGDDPRTSVVDSTCRAHGLGNLYIADSSIMPTSGGTNPSLTIAANALRVAAIIGETSRS